MTELLFWQLCAAAAFLVSLVLFGWALRARRDRDIALSLAELWQAKATEARSQRLKLEADRVGVRLDQGGAPTITKVGRGAGDRLRIRRGEGGG